MADTVRNVGRLWRRGIYRLRRTLRPQEPWIAPAAIRLLGRTIGPETRMIEWGSGASTLWFGRRVGFLLSFESDEEWYRRVRQDLDQLPESRVDYRLAPVEDVGGPSTAWPPGLGSSYVTGVNDYPDGTFDLALIDGAIREACIQVVGRKLRRDALVVLDNSDWNPDTGWGIPRDWQLVLRAPYSGTETAIWRTA